MYQKIKHKLVLAKADNAVYNNYETLNRLQEIHLVQSFSSLGKIHI